MARNPLQDQLLKAGLVKKQQLAQVVRQQQKARDGKAPAPADVEHVDAERLRAEKVERDRQLEAERRAAKEAAERADRVRQIVENHRVRGGDDSDYRFQDGERILSLRITDKQRPLLARGVLAIVRDGAGHTLVTADTAARLRAIDPAVICVDHGATAGTAPPSSPLADPDSDEAYYQRFQVPDDLVW
jgi:uncharacterized protein YaiL (DUF2058 family)